MVIEPLKPTSCVGWSWPRYLGISGYTATELQRNWLELLGGWLDHVIMSIISTYFNNKHGMIPNAEHIFQSKSLDDLKPVNWWWRLEPAQIAVMTIQPVEMGDIPPGWWTFHDFLVVNMMQNEQWPAPSLNHCYFVYECSGECRLTPENQWIKH